MSGEIEFSRHARDMLRERRISEEWVWRTIHSFDHEEIGVDGNLHYSKAIVERKGLILHVVVNKYVDPGRIITLFFDRRLKRNE